MYASEWSGGGHVCGTLPFDSASAYDFARLTAVWHVCQEYSMIWRRDELFWVPCAYGVAFRLRPPGRMEQIHGNIEWVPDVTEQSEGAHLFGTDVLTQPVRLVLRD